MCHNHRACALEPTSCNYGSPRALQQEKPLQREARALHVEHSPRLAQLEKPRMQQGRPSRQN